MKQNSQDRAWSSPLTSAKRLYQHLMRRLDAMGPLVRTSDAVDGVVREAMEYMEDAEYAGYANWDFLFSDIAMDDGSPASSLLLQHSFAMIVFLGRLHDLRRSIPPGPMPRSYVLLLLLEQFRQGAGVHASELPKGKGIRFTGQLLVDQRRPPRLVDVTLQGGTLLDFRAADYAPMDRMIDDVLLFR